MAGNINDADFETGGEGKPGKASSMVISLAFFLTDGRGRCCQGMNQRRFPMVDMTGSANENMADSKSKYHFRTDPIEPKPVNQRVYMD